MLPNVANMLPNVASKLQDGGFTEEQATKIIEILVNGRFIRGQKRNLTQEIREWVIATSGYFSATNCYRELQIATSTQMSSARVVLSRLEKEGIIKKFGDQRGHYRRVDLDVEPIDWQSATTDTVNIKWPFEIERYVETMPGNVICVAGEPNAGKTALLLNVIAQNMKAFEMHLFNSEMGNGELRKRLERFSPVVKLNDWKFNAWERSGNFADVIRPGKGVINVVDFLELHEDFWKVGGMLKEIHDKLKDAVAIVALQKNSGCEHGLGGGRGLEKPRLYLTMSPGCCKIVKAKNWATSENPNGLVINYKLHQGSHFSIAHDWHREELKA
ncbi:MAG TPA: hypothetical protein PK250_10010 [Syntrophobacter fumaroxidans]|nr:hypothetical protein [Syntrophobacter fumaroxidans]